MPILTHIINELAIAESGENSFQGNTNAWPGGHVFGGHVIAQAMDAAERSVPETYALHSFHCYFLRPGHAETPIDYDVDPIRDGRSFMTRRVTASQAGRAIFTIALNYHVPEPGYAHQLTMPDVPAPETLESDIAYLTRVLPEGAIGDRIDVMNTMPFETRSVDRMDVIKPEAKTSICGHWLKLRGELGSDTHTSLHQQLLAYMSDFAFLSSNLRPHKIAPRDGKLKMAASLDHAMWFHTTDLDVNDWIYYHTEGLWAADGRGLAKGSLYTRDGKLLATTMQESLLRVGENFDG